MHDSINKTFDKKNYLQLTTSHTFLAPPKKPKKEQDG